MRRSRTCFGQHLSEAQTLSPCDVPVGVFSGTPAQAEVVLSWGAILLGTGDGFNFDWLDNPDPHSFNVPSGVCRGRQRNAESQEA